MNTEYAGWFVALGLAGVFIVAGFAYDVGRGSVTIDCKRDGYFWINGARYACKPDPK